MEMGPPASSVRGQSCLSQLGCPRKDPEFLRARESHELDPRRPLGTGQCSQGLDSCLLPQLGIPKTGFTREAPFKDNRPGLEDGCALMGTRLAQLARGQEAGSCCGLGVPPPWGLGTVSRRQGKGSGRWADVAARSWRNAGLPPVTVCSGFPTAQKPCHSRNTGRVPKSHDLTCAPVLWARKRGTFPISLPSVLSLIWRSWQSLL